MKQVAAGPSVESPAVWRSVTPGGTDRRKVCASPGKRKTMRNNRKCANSERGNQSGSKTKAKTGSEDARSGQLIAPGRGTKMPKITRKMAKSDLIEPSGRDSINLINELETQTSRRRGSGAEFNGRRAGCSGHQPSPHGVGHGIAYRLGHGSGMFLASLQLAPDFGPVAIIKYLQDTRPKPPSTHVPPRLSAINVPRSLGLRLSDT